MILNIITLGAIFAIMSYGVHLSYKQLNFPDLSVDGSFPLGAAICATGLSLQLPLILCLILSILGGLLAGMLTGLLHTKLKLSDLLSGILVMIALYSINLRIMGRPNTPLLGLSHPFQGEQAIFSILLLLGLVKLTLGRFYKSRIGMMIRATGENPAFVTSLGLNPAHYKVLGLMIANSLVAFSGALMALYQGYADIGMGLGIMVAGLASVIIGEGLFKSVILGSLAYRAIIGLAFTIGVPPSDIKLITAALIVMMLSPALRRKGSILKRRSFHVTVPRFIQNLHHRSSNRPGSDTL